MEIAKPICTIIRRGNYMLLRVTYDRRHTELSLTGLRPVDAPLDRDYGFIGHTKEIMAINSELMKAKEYTQKRLNDLMEVNPNASFEQVQEIVRNPDRKVLGRRFSHMVEDFRERVQRGAVRNAKNGLPLSKASTEDYLKIMTTLAKVAKVADIDFGRYNLSTIHTLGRTAVMSEYTRFSDGVVSYFLNAKDPRRGRYNDRTIAYYIAAIKRMIRYFELNEGIPVGNLLDRMKYTATKPAPITMSLEQTKFLIANFEKMKRGCRGRVQKVTMDYWLAGVLTAARIGDMETWGKDNIEFQGDSAVIRYIPNKTKRSSMKEIEVPVTNKHLLAAIKASMFRYKGKLLPPITGQKSGISRTLRVIARRYEIFQNEVVVTKDIAGERITERVRFCDIMHMHMTRGTFVTNALDLGISPHLIKGITGHAENSTSFAAYVERRQDAVQQAVETMMAKLGS